jgi:hypothetical protein
MVTSVPLVAGALLADELDEALVLLDGLDAAVDDLLSLLHATERATVQRTTARNESGVRTRRVVCVLIDRSTDRPTNPDEPRIAL